MSDNLNAARGVVIIDTSQAEQAPGKMNTVAAGIVQAFTGINVGATSAEAGIASVTGAVATLAGAFGVAFGAQGIAQFGRMAIEATQTATALNRQEVAARSLAGSQERLNDLITAYQEASGGYVDKATAIANVTDLLAQGFAKSSDQLKTLVEGVRGVSVATGKSQDFVITRLQLELLNQTGQRLNEIGLNMAEVKQRTDELTAANAGLTSQQAYQRAVLDLLNQKYGELARSQEGAKTGLENAGAAAVDAKLAFGNLLGPAVNLISTGLAVWLIDQTANLNAMTNAAHNAGVALAELVGIANHPSSASRTGIGSNMREAPPTAMFNQGQKDVRLDWAKGIMQLNADTNQQLLDQNRSYQEQRASSEHQFQEATSRAAEDFNLQRQREEQDMADSIARIHRDATLREASEAADLARSIADATSASGERVAKARSDANARLVELDANYEKERAKRAQDLNDSLMDAAGQLDAKQVYELQRNAARQEEEAKQAHDDQRDKLQKQLAERLDDEQKSLAKSIQQQQDAYDRRLQDERDADAQRITDMQTAFDKRKVQEDFDYGLRMTRMQQDHNDQLTEMDRQQGLRIQQIKDHAAAERTQLDTEHQTALTKLGVHNQEWVDAETKLNNDALKLLDQILGKGRSLILFPNAGSNTLPFPSMIGANASAYSGTGTGSTYNNSSRTFNPTVNVNIAGGSSLTQKQVDDAVHDALMRVFEETAQ